MQEITAKLPPYTTADTYPIYAGPGSCGKLREILTAKAPSTVAVVSDPNLAGGVLARVEKEIPGRAATVLLPAGEQGKEISSIETLWKFFKRERLDRNAVVLAVGGGAVCDAAGFAAATYLRGVGFIAVPTTLLAQVDAAVGGKCGINFEGVKNLIGSFSPPQAVIVDTEFLITLPPRGYLSGYAEIAKHALLDSPELVSRLSQSGRIDASDPKLLDLIIHSLEYKNRVLAADFREEGPRKLLNLGHTAGHALEAFSYTGAKPLTHGEAVALGILAEARMAEIAGRLPTEEFKKTEALLAALGFETKLPFPLKFSQIEPYLLLDKKNLGGRVLWTLLSRAGEAHWNVELPPATVKKGLEYIGVA